MTQHRDILDVSSEDMEPVGEVAERAEKSGQSLAKREAQDNVPASTENVPESTAIFQIIARLANDPNADPERIERFLAMRDRELERLARIEFFTAMKAAQAEMPQVVRDADNDQTKSRYARYETISEAIQPIITKCGFSLTFSEGTPARDNHIRVLCDVMHEAGYVKQYHADIPFDNVGMKGNANKTATHAYGSTKSYGKRYLKCDIFDVALKNEDDDGIAAGRGPVERVNEEQLTTLRRLIEETDTDIERFCEIGKIDSIPDMLAKDFPDAVRLLEQKKARLEKERAA